MTCRRNDRRQIENSECRIAPVLGIALGLLPDDAEGFEIGLVHTMTMIMKKTSD